MRQWVKLFFLAIAAGVLMYAPLAFTQSQQPQEQDQKTAKQAAKERAKKDKEAMKELASPYKKWLDEDVLYIITSEERSAFLHLSTNEQRETFIEDFWQRRNPDPDSPDNTFKEEHYRRIAYANERFASGLPGWKTDRGRIYIIWGPADQVDSHPTGGTYERPAAEGGGNTSTYPFEDWRYRYLEGIGENVEIEFVDPSMSGEYRLTMDPSEKDALLYVPGAGLTLAEQWGLSSKTDRFSNADGTHTGMPLGARPESMNEFNRMDLFSKINQPPPVKFKDLEAVVTSRVVRDQIKFSSRFYALRITSDTVLVPITVQIPTRQLSFQQKDGVESASVNIFARITSLSGRIIQTFEDTVRRDVPTDLLQKELSTSSIYQKAVPLSPGRYRLDIVLKDVNSGNVGVESKALPVPRFDEDHLAFSSLILADQIQRVSAKDIGLGQFVLGDLKVRPKIDAIFTPKDSMGVFLQIYNLKVDDKTHKADASVQYRVLKNGGNPGDAPVLKLDLAPNQMPDHGEEMTLDSSLTLGSLAPGKYNLEVAVTDNLTKQTLITPASEFTIKPSPAATP